MPLHPVPAATLLLALASSAHAQTPVVFPTGGAPFAEAWVDPTCPTCIGVVGSRTQPYSTINDAINDLVVQNPGGPSIVHALPGVYSATTNGEFFPIRMRGGVTVQGVEARACVLRGTGLDPLQQVFIPRGGNACRTGGLEPRRVLVDFSLVNQGDSRLDGCTLQGSDIQVYARNETDDFTATVSNCVLDMLDDSDAVAIGPIFGVLMVHDFDLDYSSPFEDDAEADAKHYRNIPLNILGNTFIQGMYAGPFGAARMAARADSVAVCDVNNPLDPGSSFPTPDANQVLRGVGRPNIQNNIIRSLPDDPRTAMIGIRGNAVRASVGTVIGETNAFDDSLAGSFDLTQTFCSLASSQAKSLISTNPLAGGRDPAFVGECISRDLNGDGTESSADASVLLANPAFVTHFRDWRILPTSPMRGLGSAPVAGILEAVNGTRFIETFPAISPFDFDGEGYGNPRVDTMGRTDLGADQSGPFVDAGAANDSLVFDTSATGLPYPLPATMSLRRWIVPTSAGAVRMSKTTTVPAPLGYSLLPTLNDPAFVIGGLPAGGDIQWIGLGLAGNSVPTTAVAYRAPFESVTQSFSRIRPLAATPSTPTSPVTFAGRQLVLLRSSARLLTNAQVRME